MKHKAIDLQHAPISTLPICQGHKQITLFWLLTFVLFVACLLFLTILMPIIVVIATSLALFGRDTSNWLWWPDTWR